MTDAPYKGPSNDARISFSESQQVGIFQKKRASAKGEISNDLPKNYNSFLSGNVCDLHVRTVSDFATIFGTVLIEVCKYVVLLVFMFNDLRLRLQSHSNSKLYFPLGDYLTIWAFH